jgi:hypothetical protein
MFLQVVGKQSGTHLLLCSKQASYYHRCALTHSGHRSNIGRIKVMQ